MEALGAGASIIAIIELSTEVTGFISRAKGAKKERKRLREELEACNDVLQQLKAKRGDSKDDATWARSIQALERPNAPLCRLSIALNTVKAKLAPKDTESKIMTALRWPFESKEVEKMIDTIEREKGLLMLALTAEYQSLVQELEKNSKENTTQLSLLVEMIISTSLETQTQYAKLSSDLVRIQQSQNDLNKGINQLRQNSDQVQVNIEDKTILEWLTPIDYAPQQSDFFSGREPGTGQWFLDSTDFKAWIESDEHILFCPGIPGAGKTILTSIVIDYLYNTFQTDNALDSDIGIAYIYCNYNKKAQQTADDLLASLLKQLCQMRSSLPTSLRDLYEQHHSRRTRPPLDKLSKVLQSVVAMFTRVFIVIDALDECSTADGSLGMLLKELSKLKVNFFATSRFIREIDDAFDRNATLEIVASTEDVRKYVNSHLCQLSSCVRNNSILQEEIKSDIVRSAEGMFLLAKLYFDLLRGKTSPKAIRRALSTLPAGSEKKAYDFAYEKAMKRISGQIEEEVRLATQVLSWIVCAKRPLTSLELQHAIAVEPGESELDPENLTPLEDMVSVCAGLVTVDKRSDCIRLVHYTTQEYFQRTREDWFPNVETSLLQTCVTYLSFSTFESGYCETRDELQQRRQLNPFYTYTACYWSYHAQMVLSSYEVLKPFLCCEPKMKASLQAESTLNWMGWFIGGSTLPNKITGLHLAAHYGNLELVDSLLADGWDFQKGDSYGKEPMAWAVRSGFTEVVLRFLAAYGVDAYVTDGRGETLLSWTQQNELSPIVWAIEHENLETMRQLIATDRVDLNVVYSTTIMKPLLPYLDRGQEVLVDFYLFFERTRVDKEDQDGWTPLMLALDRRRELLANLLLESGRVDVLVENPYGWSPLMAAVDEDYYTAVKLLLEIGKMGSEDMHEAVVRAARGAHLDIIKLLGQSHPQARLSNTEEWPDVSNTQVVNLLADFEVFPNSQIGWGELALLAASFQGHECIVQLLLARGSDVETRDIHGRTPLLWASIRGHETIVDMLLNKGALKDAKDKNLRTSLTWASISGHTAIVRLLLHKAANMEALDETGQTPLLWAIKKDFEAIVKLLLQNGAELETNNETGQTPLLCATKCGSELIVRSLLEKGANVEIRDENYQTPLMWATKNGSEPIVRLLLEKGADTETLDKDLQTPLLWAVRREYEYIVRFLLEKGANVELRDENGQTPLLWAALSGFEPIVRLLLKKGADTEIRDGTGQTPLHWASALGHAAVVKSLLDGGAHANARDERGRTALLIASQRGEVTTVRLLLDKGASLEEKDRSGYTPLCCAVEARHQDVVQILLEGGISLKSWTPAKPSFTLFSCDTSLSYRRSIRWKKYQGHLKGDWMVELLQSAVLSPTPRMCQLLHETGFPLDIQDAGGHTFLSWLARCRYDFGLPYATVLLQTGANPNAKDLDNSSPLLGAASSGSYAVAQLLIRHGADIEDRDSSGRTPLIMAAQSGCDAIARLLVGHGANIEARDCRSRTALIVASMYGSVDVIKVLLSLGADLSATFDDGQTILGRAAGHGDLYILSLLLKAENIDLEMRDAKGRTALTSAARYGHLETVKLLLENGLDANSKDNNNWTPLAHASEEGREKIAELLRKRTRRLSV